MSDCKCPICVMGGGGSAPLVYKAPNGGRPVIQIDKYMDAPESYGGKAAGLARLMAKGFTVPRSFVVPCNYYHKRPEIDLRNIVDHFGNYRVRMMKWAVRSGAPVSMPGLMKTRLNVEWDDIPAAIIEVWDSFDSEHAKAYREANGISHDIGTAVVIQPMVEGIRYAGVCFTDDPHNSEEDVGMFNPVIEYVEGLGEALVSGEKTPERATPGHMVWDYTYNIMRKIHDKLGASDVEWVLCTNGNVFLVQHRPLKYAPKVTVPLDTQGRDLVLRGKPIGAAVGKLAQIAVLDYTDVKPGNAVHVSQFNPEHYSVMTKAGAILVLEGGATCHAAIIANTLGLPAISGIKREQALKLAGKKLYIDGASGAILSAKEGDEIATETKIEQTPEFYRLPDLRIANSKIKYNALNLMWRFYYTMDEFKKGTVTAERRDEVVGEIAKILVTYFYIATICELRWLWTRAEPCFERRKTYSALARLGLRFPKTCNPCSRNHMAMEIPSPVDVAQAATIMKWVKHGFSQVPWGGSFGGPKWGRIAGLAMSYISGELSAPLFVDNTFNLQHNGGIAFNKFDWLTVDGCKAQQALNIRQKYSVKALYNYIKSCMYMTDLDKYATQQSILPKGIIHDIKQAA